MAQEPNVAQWSNFEPETPYSTSRVKTPPLQISPDSSHHGRMQMRPSFDADLSLELRLKTEEMCALMRGKALKALNFEGECEAREDEWHHPSEPFRSWMTAMQSKNQEEEEQGMEMNNEMDEYLVGEAFAEEDEEVVQFCAYGGFVGTSGDATDSMVFDIEL
jgi:hypothetical protein